jgi:hypothetical protein
MYLCDRQLHDSMKILHVLQNPLLSSTGCVTSSFEYDEHQTRGRTFDYALVVQNDAGQVTGGQNTLCCYVWFDHVRGKLQKLLTPRYRQDNSDVCKNGPPPGFEPGATHNLSNSVRRNYPKQVSYLETVSLELKLQKIA